MSSIISVESQAIETTQATTSRRQHRVLMLVVATAVAFVLRVAFAQFDNMAWPDEIYQTQEPAHHLAFGPWVVTWEYLDGARNWVFPAFLATVMRGTSWMGEGSVGYLLGVRIVLSLLSSIPVYVAALWVERYEGVRGAMVAALGCACWYELIYYGPKALTEVAAADLLLPGLYLVYFSAGKPAGHKMRDLISGSFLLGFAMALRMQVAPIVVFAIVWCCFKSGKRMLLAFLCSAFPVFIFGLVDYLTWGIPFQSYVVNYRFNTAPGPHPFGDSPWWFYVVNLFRNFWVLILLAVLGAARVPFLGALVVTLILTHSAIGHKEYRFLNPVLIVIVLLATIGLLNLIDSVVDRMRWRRVKPIAPALACLCLLCCSVRQGFAFPGWRQSGGGLTLFSDLNRDETLCGVGLVQTGFYLYGGYTYLHRAVPLYVVQSFDALPKSQRAFNVMFSDVAPRKDVVPFVLTKCDRGICEYRRSGGCVAAPSFEINLVLAEYARRRPNR